MSKPTVLVVDGDQAAVRIVTSCLDDEGFQVETAASGRAALEKVKQTRPSLVLLDSMLPEMNGWEVCKQLRRDGDVPIIFVTARGGDADKVAGLELGADDYITKPFSPRELVARVKAVLRRCEEGRTLRQVIHFADLTIDHDRGEFRIGNRPVKLRPMEFDLLAMLAANPGVVFDRERLLQIVWGYEYYGDSRTVDVHVTWLRDKLAPSRARIKTVWGVGYKLVPVDELSAASSETPSAPSSA